MGATIECDNIHTAVLMNLFEYIFKVHPCTGTEALYRPYGP